jgi:predicted ArsR family transcriptional regulator
MRTAADRWCERSGAVRSEGHWIAALHHTAQRLLERRSVVISFAEPADDALAARSTVAGFLSELEDKGFLDAAEAAAGGRGRPPKAWKPTDREDDAGDVLPTAAEIFSEGEKARKI